MFNDDYLKFESQLLVIDVMMKSIDEVLEFIRRNDVQKEELTKLISKIFDCCKRIIELVPQFNMSIYTSKQRLLNSIEIVQKYWNENDTYLFTINWFLFVAHWNEFAKSIKTKDKSEKFDLNYFFVN